MPDWNPEVNELFAKAIELESPDERQAFLDEACGDNANLRTGVEKLLKAHDDAGSFLNQPAAGLVPTIATGENDTFDESADEDLLDFLTPTDRPGCLGILGQYEAIEVVGRGGMGLVLRAYDTKLSRVVAIKVMAPELAANPMAVKRFLREARAAAAVSHEHAVTIHAIEEDHKPPFIVMEFVDGKSLQQKISESGALGSKEILRIGMQTARGLAAAHEQGLVHRDIKPANILLENGVERVKLTDFGLARATDDVSVTQTGQIAGTPQYMSPEQAEGKSLDARSDLFSLGSVLYTMCTGRPPFRADTAVAMLRRVTEDDPRPVREVNTDVPEWLESVIFRLLAKNPDDRLQSAAEVAELLGRYLAHLQDPQSVPRPQTVAVAKTSTRSSEGSWMSTAIGVVVTLLMLFAVRALWHHATDTGTVIVDADDESLVVEFTPILNETTNGRKQKVTFNVSDQVEHFGSGSVDLASGRYSVSLGDRRDEFDISQNRFTLGRGREVEIRIRRKYATLPAMQMERLFSGHSGTVTAVDISPDGQFALSASGWPDGDGTLRLWNLKTAREVRRFKGLDGPVVRARFSPDGRRVIAGGTRHAALVYDVDTGEQVAQFNGIRSPFRHGIALTPDGRHALIGEGVGSVHICSLATGEIIHTLRQPDDRVMAIAVSPDGTRALATSGDEVYVWNLETRRQIGRLRGHTKLIQSVAFSSDGRRAVTAGIDGSVRLWTVETQEETRRFLGHQDGVLCARFTPNDRFIVSSGHDHTIRVWNVTTGEEVARTRDPGRSVWSIAVTPDGRRILGGGGQKSDRDSFRVKEFDLRLWRMPDSVRSASQDPEGPDNSGFAEVRRLETAGKHRIVSSAVSGNVRWLATGHSDGTIFVRNPASGQVVRSLIGHQRPVEAVTFSPDGESLFSAAQDSTVRHWAIASETEIGRFEGHTGWVRALALSADGEHLVTGSTWYAHQHQGRPQDNTLRLWDVATRREVHRFKGVTDPVRTVAMSPGGDRIVAGGDHKSMGLWDVRTGERLHGFEVPSSVLSVAWSGDGRQIASGHAAETRIAGKWSDPGNGVVQLWDAEACRLLHQLQGHAANVNALAFSDNGRFLISGSGGRWGTSGWVDAHINSLRVWNVTTGQDVAGVELNSTVRAICPEGDGKHVIVAGGRWDSTVATYLARWQLPASVWSDRSPTGGQEKPEDASHANSQVDPLRVARRVFSGPQARGVTSLAVTPDGTRVVAGGYEGKLNVWELDTGRHLHSLPGHTGLVHAVDVTSDGRFAVSGSEEPARQDSAEHAVPSGRILVWDLQSGERVRELDSQNARVQVVRFSPDDNAVLTVNTDFAGKQENSAWLWSAETGELIRELDIDDEWIVDARFSPDGTRIAAPSQSLSRSLLIDVATGAVIHQFSQQLTDADHVAWSPDGRYLVFGHRCTKRTDGKWNDPENCVLRMIDTETLQLVRTFHGHAGPVSAVEFSPDGDRLLSASSGAHDRTGTWVDSSDESVRVWDVATGEQLVHIEEVGRINAAVFTTDGRGILTGGREALRLWELPERVWLTAERDDSSSLDSPDSDQQLIQDR